MEGWRNKIFAIIKGPSWLPGRPWAGCDADKIDVILSILFIYVKDIHNILILNT